MVDSAELSVDSLKTAIGDILKSSELSSLTSRMVRSNLEERFNVCLKHRKKEIDKLLMTMIEESQVKTNEDSDEPTNGAVDDENESESEDDHEDYEPAPKKSKKEKKSKESTSSATAKKMEHITDSEPEEEELDDHDDAEIARKLHESERGLRTRKQPAKRTLKSSTKKELKPKGEKGRTGFGKLMVLSPELADIMGTDKLARSEVVKKMWQIIRERNLADPKDKRYHICDDQLLKVFGTKRVKTFSMMKYLKPHVKDPALIT